MVWATQILILLGWTCWAHGRGKRAPCHECYRIVMLGEGWYRHEHPPTLVSCLALLRNDRGRYQCSYCGLRLKSSKSDPLQLYSVLSRKSRKQKQTSVNSLNNKSHPHQIKWCQTKFKSQFQMDKLLWLTYLLCCSADCSWIFYVTGWRIVHYLFKLYLTIIMHSITCKTEKFLLPISQWIIHIKIKVNKRLSMQQISNVTGKIWILFSTPSRKKNINHNVVAYFLW